MKCTDVIRSLFSSKSDADANSLLEKVSTRSSIVPPLSPLSRQKIQTSIDTADNEARQRREIRIQQRQAQETRDAITNAFRAETTPETPRQTPMTTMVMTAVTQGSLTFMLPSRVPSPALSSSYIDYSSVTAAAVAIAATSEDELDPPPVPPPTPTLEPQRSLSPVLDNEFLWWLSFDSDVDGRLALS